jgi:hypothetical protein
MRIDHRIDNLHLFQAELGEPLGAIDRGELAAVSWFDRQALPDELGRYVDRILARLSG